MTAEPSIAYEINLTDSPVLAKAYNPLFPDQKVVLEFKEINNALIGSDDAYIKVKNLLRNKYYQKYLK